MFDKGDFVTVNQRLGVVVMTGEQLAGDLDDHTAVWFGDCDGGAPEVWTIPSEYLEHAATKAVIKH